MRNLWRLIVGVVIISFGIIIFPSHGQGQVDPMFKQNFSAGTQADTMHDVLAYFCRKINPYDQCGTYQHEIDQAKIRANQLLGLLSSYPQAQQERMLENLALRVQGAFYTARDTNTKVVMAWYYTYLTKQSQQFITSPDLFSLLFDNGNTLRDVRVNNTVRTPITPIQPRISLDRYRITPPRGYEPARPEYRYQSNRGTIENIWSLGSLIKVDRSRKYIDLQGRNVGLKVGIKANAGGRNASVHDGYRVVATVDRVRQTYPGRYISRSGSWEFDLPRSVMSNARYVEFSLICNNCNTGKRFQGQGYNTWDVLDVERYDIRPGLQQPSYKVAGVGISDLKRQYDRYRNQLFLDITTTVRNYGSAALEFDGVSYEIYVEGKKLNQRDYRIEAEYSSCTNISTTSRRYAQYRIGGQRTCDFDISLEIDRNRVNVRDRVQVKVIIDAPRNRWLNTNTTNEFSFYIWE